MHELITVAGGILLGTGIALFFWGRRGETKAVASGDGASLEIDIEGMTCAACVSRVEKALLRVPGVVSAEVSLAVERGRVRFDPVVAVPDDILAAVRKVGYGAREVVRVSPEEREARRLRELGIERNRLILSLVCFLPLMFSMVPGAPRLPWFTEAALAGVATFVAGGAFLKRAAKALRARSADMTVLISIGTLSAFFYSVYLSVSGHAEHNFFETAAGLIALVTLGRYLEMRARAKAGEAMKALAKLQPEKACLLTPSGEHEIPAGSLSPGDRVLVRPGQRIPADGVVRTGESEADESLLTGESAPVPKHPGDRVYAGSIVGSGALEVEVDLPPGDSALMRVLRMVEAAQASRPPIQRLADRISAVFVPVIMLVAVGTFVLWFGFFPSFGLERAVMNAVTVLIIACPCALGLATPASIVVGVGRGASLGLLFRSAEALERLGSVRQVLFDKTGTLTHGMPAVVAVNPARDVLEEDLLRAAAAIESASEHPLARAIVSLAEERGIEYERPANTRAVSGLGVRAEWADGRIGLVGRGRLLEEAGISVPPQVGMSSTAHTVVEVALCGSYLGRILLGDPVRPEAAEAVAALNALGIRVGLVTGDNEATARAVASQIGIENVWSEVLPDEKARVVMEVRAAVGPTAMVGDGVNDAPALAAADVGVAMDSGTEAAVETADVTIIGSDLRSVPQAVELSRATSANIRQNLFFAFVYNCLCVPLAAGALYPITGHFLPPLAAAAAMAFSSVSVVSNSLSLRSWRPRCLDR